MVDKNNAARYLVRHRCGSRATMEWKGKAAVGQESGERRNSVVRERFAEMTSRATQAWTGTLEKTREAFALTSDVNRDIAGRTAGLSVAIAREGVQYLGEVQAALRQASADARELWTRQRGIVEELPKDVMGASQKAVVLSWDGGGQMARLVDQQREALTRFGWNVQNLLEKAGRETHETVAKYAEQILALYGLKN